ncbi:MAG: Hsp20/alpha crystallin family protein [Herminiimonas sp.]|nr:Hsp20/alpha crystallin family protein [Herminiimonas sp.]
MNIIRRDPSPLSIHRSSMADPFSSVFDNMIEEFFSPMTPFASSMLQTDGGERAGTRMNVVETDKSFEVEAELPTMKKEDLNVVIDDRRVTIEPEAKREPAQTEAGKVVNAERLTRKYGGSFMFPVEIDDTGAQSRLENGVLFLTLTKKTAAQTKKSTIQ